MHFLLLLRKKHYYCCCALIHPTRISMSNLNKYKYPGAKRLMLEAQELKDTTEDYCAQPLEDNLFEWHFTLRGPPETPFEGGCYHGRLIFPTDYPMKPPSIILLTPNGRFETNKKICLSISGHHPETWQPSWSVRTALLALIAFMPTKANRAIGSLDYSDAERRKLALKSREWRCESCGIIKDLLAKPGGQSSENPQHDEGTNQLLKHQHKSIKTPELETADDQDGNSMQQQPASRDLTNTQHTQQYVSPLVLKSFFFLLISLIVRRFVIIVTQT